MESMLLSNVARFWFAIPLIIAISLVYAATRHELMEPILIHRLANRRLDCWLYDNRVCHTLGRRDDLALSMPLASIITHILIALRFKDLRLSCLRQNGEKT